MDEKTVMLIVDDVEINRAVLSQFFQDEYTVLEAVNGQEALKIIESQPVGIVLVDLVMLFVCGLFLTGSPLLAPGEDGINGVNLANSSQLSAWTGREVSNPCDPEEYAAELNKLIEAMKAEA